MKVFISKTITARSEVFPKMWVRRSRATTGLAGISLGFEDQSISLHDLDREDEPGDYEQKALELVKLLNEVASNPCLLPEEEDSDEI